MPSKDFLESYPLYKKYELEIDSNIPSPPINFFCSQCNSTQTFNMENSNYQWEQKLKGLYMTAGSLPGTGDAIADHERKDFVEHITYTCASCEKESIDFFLHFSPENSFVEKAGQLPPWSIDIDQSIKDSLGEYTSLYKKGLICESQGYGIGSFSYYRRIIEEIIDDLLNELSNLIEGPQKESYLSALESVKESKNATEKINVVKNLLPDSLRPDGHNPLSLIHDSLSVGIHSEDDEECLEQAGYIRTALVYLKAQINLSQQAQREFTVSIKKLLDKKSGNN